MSHYDTLNVPRDASQDDIKSAYRRAARNAHPDRAGGDTEQMAKVNRAYQVLSDPEARARYDQTGEESAPTNDPVTATIIELFEMSIDGCDGDVLAFCEKKIASALSEISNREDSAKRSIKKLNKKRDRVRAKTGGENLYTQLIDGKIRAEEDLLGQAAAARKTMTGARDRLRDYESTYVPEPMGHTAAEQQMRDGMANDLLEQMFRDVLGSGFFSSGSGRQSRRPW